ncbi:hypothetical protein PHMEG_00023560 [Phytophthora megakarya]|uniref:Uncharacterized protein n=1 Tax=Phytophthora megakarya TaxID=4795 RepID=A0A225VJ13_9STRA|nr:hypothetical protein PHMEG_00023560 [Phytophthora megakarya]
MPGRQVMTTPASPASGHDTDTPGTFQRGKRKYSHTTAAQRQCLLEWLELPGNFHLLTKPLSVKAADGSATSSATSSPPPKRLKKTDGYRSLAEYMNRVALTDWTEKTARSRFESFMAAYRKAKRLNPPDQLSVFYQRVDALFGPDGDREARFRSESLGQRSEGSRSPLSRESETVFPDLTPDARARVAEDESVSSPLGELSSVTTEQAMRLESQRLAVRQQELELRQNELRARQQESRQKLRAEVLTRLVEAGKSPAEVREYLAIMDIDTR